MKLILAIALLAATFSPNAGADSVAADDLLDRRGDTTPVAGLPLQADLRSSLPGIDAIIESMLSATGPDVPIPSRGHDESGLENGRSGVASDSSRPLPRATVVIESNAGVHLIESRTLPPQ